MVYLWISSGTALVFAVSHCDPVLLDGANSEWCIWISLSFEDAVFISHTAHGWPSYMCMVLQRLLINISISVVTCPAAETCWLQLLRLSNLTPQPVLHFGTNPLSSIPSLPPPSLELHNTNFWLSENSLTTLFWKQISLPIGISKHSQSLCPHHLASSPP